MLKIPVIVKPDYIWYIESFEGLSFMHCDVFNWNKTVWKNLKQDFLTFAELHGRTMYVCKEHETTGYLKFIKGLGFKLLKSIEGKNNNELYVYYWEQ